MRSRPLRHILHTANRPAPHAGTNPHRTQPPARPAPHRTQPTGPPADERSHVVIWPLCGQIRQLLATIMKDSENNLSGEGDIACFTGITIQATRPRGPRHRRSNPYAPMASYSSGAFAQEAIPIPLHVGDKIPVCYDPDDRTRMAVDLPTLARGSRAQARAGAGEKARPRRSHLGRQRPGAGNTRQTPALRIS
jgi:hypothetical protein